MRYKIIRNYSYNSTNGSTWNSNEHHGVICHAGLCTHSSKTSGFCILSHCQTSRGAVETDQGRSNKSSGRTKIHQVNGLGTEGCVASCDYIYPSPSVDREMFKGQWSRSLFFRII